MKRRAWNSTLPAPEKPLSRHVPIRVHNQERQKKRKARTAKKRASSHTKQWRLDVLARDGNRCTAEVSGYGDTHRCPETENLHVHHVTSVRMGAERLEDGITLCKVHHEYEEQRLRWWKKGRAS